MELSILCDCEIALIIFSSNNKLFQYSSKDMDKILIRYTDSTDNSRKNLTNQDYKRIFGNKKLKTENGADEDDDDDEDLGETPTTPNCSSTNQSPLHIGNNNSNSSGNNNSGNSHFPNGTANGNQNSVSASGPSSIPNQTMNSSQPHAPQNYVMGVPLIPKYQPYSIESDLAPLTPRSMAAKYKGFPIHDSHKHYPSPNPSSPMVASKNGMTKPGHPYHSYYPYDLPQYQYMYSNGGVPPQSAGYMNPQQLMSYYNSMPPQQMHQYQQHAAAVAAQQHQQAAQAAHQQQPPSASSHPHPQALHLSSSQHPSSSPLMQHHQSQPSGAHSHQHPHLQQQPSSSPLVHHHQSHSQHSASPQTTNSAHYHHVNVHHNESSSPHINFNSKNNNNNSNNKPITNSNNSHSTEHTPLLNPFSKPTSSPSTHSSSNPTPPPPSLTISSINNSNSSNNSSNSSSASTPPISPAVNSPSATISPALVPVVTLEDTNKPKPKKTLSVVIPDSSPPPPPKPPAGYGALGIIPRTIAPLNQDLPPKPENTPILPSPREFYPDNLVDMTPNGSYFPTHYHWSKPSTSSGNGLSTPNFDFTSLGALPSPVKFGFWSGEGNQTPHSLLQSLSNYDDDKSKQVGKENSNSSNNSGSKIS